MGKAERTKAQRAYVLRKLALTRLRQKAWREQPEKMETIRKTATLKAKTVKDENNRQVRIVVSTWPERMTTDELRANILASLDYPGAHASLTYRFTRHGMLRFMPDGLWHNLCRLPSL